jgi:hypothetical protein
MARRARGVFEREEWEIKEQRVQLETLKRTVRWRCPQQRDREGR